MIFTNIVLEFLAHIIRGGKKLQGLEKRNRTINKQLIKKFLNIDNYRRYAKQNNFWMIRWISKVARYKII